MWAVYFGDLGSQQVNSGVAVLETGRVFGGDSMMAYLGTYAIRNGEISSELRVWAYNPNQIVTTAFGKMGTPEGSTVALSGKFNAAQDQMDGFIWEVANPTAKIPAQLKKVAELP
jgi:hypothetical protein